MKTSEERASGLRETEKNALVLRLERTQEDLNQLRGQLSSYRCEPRTHGLFEYIESLKRGMDRLSHTNNEVINSLKEQKKAVGDYFEEAKQQFSEFNRLKSKVEDYRTKCLGY
jgi:chromosome segregation ATPase